MNISPKGNFANEVRDIIVRKIYKQKNCKTNINMTFDYVKTAFKAFDDGPG